MQSVIHYFMHFGVPLIVAYVFFRDGNDKSGGEVSNKGGNKYNYKIVYLWFLATMLVDLDHLLATPIFSPNRCSIQFHPLHTYYAMIVYTGMLLLPKPYRLIGLGLLWHMLTDLNDCVMTYTRYPEALTNAPAYDLVSWLAKFIRY